MPSRASERINFGKIKEIIAPPNLIELQTTSYREFLQLDVAPSRRKNIGLQAVFKEVFPIESYDGKCVLDYHSYEIGEPKNDWLESLREGITFGAPLYVTFLLKEDKATKEEKVFMGELPLMTPQGTFVINGAERVIVSQLHRSPGLAFEATQHPNGKMLHSFRIIPDHHFLPRTDFPRRQRRRIRRRHPQDVLRYRRPKRSRCGKARRHSE